MLFHSLLVISLCFYSYLKSRAPIVGSPGFVLFKIKTDIWFRVYIANILLLLLLLTVSQVRCAFAPVYSNQLIKFELLTQSIRQRSCQSAVDPAVRMALTFQLLSRKVVKNICMEDQPISVLHTICNIAYCREKVNHKHVKLIYYYSYPLPEKDWGSLSRSNQPSGLACHSISTPLSAFNFTS